MSHTYTLKITTFVVDNLDLNQTITKVICLSEKTGTVVR